MISEKWKSIAGYEGLYEVSSRGRVRFSGRTYQRGSGTYTVKKKILKTSSTKSGHLIVWLRPMVGDSVLHYVHRLVLEAFIGPCPEGMECRHFPDQDPANNNLENLSWDTRSQNTVDRGYRGEVTTVAKLTETDVRSARKLFQKGESLRSIGRRYGVSHATIRDVVLRNTWRHVK